MFELAQSLETGSPALADINGLGYKLNGQPVINDKRPFIKNLDQTTRPSLAPGGYEKVYGNWAYHQPWLWLFNAPIVITPH